MQLYLKREVSEAQIHLTSNKETKMEMHRMVNTCSLTNDPKTVSY